MYIFPLAGSTRTPYAALFGGSTKDRKRGNPTKKQNGYHLHIVLYDDVAETLERNIRETGFSKKLYISRLIKGTPIKSRPAKEIEKLYTEINHIGNNINQIAKAMNSGFGTDDDVRQSRVLLQKVYDLMYKVASA